MGSRPQPAPPPGGDHPVRYRVVGRYVICDEIAAGGMATVHVGRLLGPAGFSRTVAIKRLHAQFAKDPDFVDMFMDEARIAGRIRHPNVVPILDFVQHEGELLLIMEYVHGESLARLARACRAATGRGVPVPIALSIVSAALYGLHAAHEAQDDRGAPLGIVHRDVSPQNILVSQDGVARVVDFGVAKAAGRIQATREGALKGKLRYMAPEQAASDHVDRRTDIYAASVVLWEILTGHRLYEAENEMNLFRSVVQGAVRPPSAVAPELPAVVDALVMRGLCRDPAERYATAWDMAEAAQRIAYATPGQVGTWVKQVGGAALDARAARVTEIESTWVLSSERLSLVDVEDGSTLSLVDDAATMLMPPKTAPPPPAPPADVQSQITSLNVATTPRRGGRTSLALLALVPIAGLGIAVATLRGAPPASTTAAVPTASEAPPAPSAPPVTSAAPPEAPAPPPAPSASASVKPRPRPAAKPNCNPPFKTNAQGVRIPKLECL